VALYEETNYSGFRMNDTEVLIVGGGISGCLVACELHDAGFDVLIVDKNEDLISESSRWNEGKIHLGYTYLGLPSLQTARLMMEGASLFVDKIEQITGCLLADSWWTRRMIYLVDSNSLVPSEDLWIRAQKVTALLKDMARRKPGLRRYISTEKALRRISTKTVMEETRQNGFTDAWETSEKSIDPFQIACLIRHAVSERGIPKVKARVTGFSRQDNYWCTHTNHQKLTSNWVVNASWESRAWLDKQIKDDAEPICIRYKCALFGRGAADFAKRRPTSRILGPYGDITPYQNGAFYLSWYPVNLVSISETGMAPKIGIIDENKMKHDTLEALGLNGSDLGIPIEDIGVRGGYIVAYGHGDIDTMSSALHDRSRPSVKLLHPGYISIDTGKYSLGPYMASQAVQLIISGST